MSRIDTGYINQEMISMIAGHIRDAGLHVAITRPALNVVQIDAIRTPFALDMPVARVTASFQDQQEVHIRRAVYNGFPGNLDKVGDDITFTDSHDMVHGHKISGVMKPVLNQLLTPA